MSASTPLSYWLATGPRLDTPPDLPDCAQVVVLGGGVFGVSAALFLARAGADVLVLEQRCLSGGATGRNAGIVAPGTTQNYLTLGETAGWDTARQVWQFTEDSSALLKRVLVEEGIEAEQRVEGAHSVAMTPTEVETQQRTMDRLATDGFDLAWLDRNALQDHVGLPLPPAFLGSRFNPRGMLVHSARLVVGLAQAAQRYGAQLRQGVRVLSVAEGRVETDRGTVHADHVVLATNAYTGRLVPALDGVIVPTRGQMRSTVPLPGRVFRGSWSANEGGEYWQQTLDGSWVLGGMRRRAADAEVGYLADDLNPVVQAALDQFAAEHFPDLASAPVSHRWAGSMGFTPDGRPLIGPLRADLWMLAGCTGHGMPFATEAGRQIAGWICRGQPDRDMTPFAPGRFL